MDDRLLLSHAYMNVLSNWKGMIRLVQYRTEMRKQAGVNDEIANRVDEAEIGIYETAIANLEAKRRELIGADKN